MRQIADLLAGFSCEARLRYDGVVGVPEAGEPFAEEFAKVINVPLLRLDKREENGSRHIVAGSKLKESILATGLQSGQILVVDDLITEAHSKIEAVDALRSVQFAHFTVCDVLVFVDREQGGAGELARVGCTLHAAWGMSELLDFFLDRGFLAQNKYDEVKAYLRG